MDSLDIIIGRVPMKAIGIGRSLEYLFRVA